jgi:hypothetical protein
VSLKATPKKSSFLYIYHIPNLQTDFHHHTAGKIYSQQKKPAPKDRLINKISENVSKM